MNRLAPELARVFENKATLTQEYLPATATEGTITDLAKKITASHSADLIVIAYGEDSLASAISQSSYISNVRNLLQRGQSFDISVSLRSAIAPLSVRFTAPTNADTLQEWPQYRCSVSH
jgi:hypothetical protein